MIKNSTQTTKRRLSSNAEIGDVAGSVWELLNAEGDQSLAAIKKSIDAPADLVAAAVGWLAREDKLEFTSNGRTTRVALRTR